MTNKLNYFSTIKFLSKYIKKYKKHFILFGIGWIMDTLISIAAPILLGVLIDEIIYYQNINTFLKICLIFVFIMLFSCVLYFFIYAQHHYLMNMFTYEIKKDIMRHWQHGDAKSIVDIPAGEVIVLLQNYSNECLHFVIRNVVHFINGIIKLIIVTVYLTHLSWAIGLLGLIAAPTSIFISNVFGKKNKEYGIEQRDVYGCYIGWLNEILRAIKDIRVLRAEKHITNKFNTQNKKIIDLSIKVGFITLTTDSLLALVNLCIKLIMFLFAAYLAQTSNLTMGNFMIILSLYLLLSDQIKWTSSSYVDSQYRITYIQKIYDFLQTPKEQWYGNKKLQISKGNIIFENVSFSYDNKKNVLDNLSLTIKQGERIALVGHSGCGKSTLAYLLLGFYNISNGTVKIDDQVLSECSLKSIRKNIGLITQKVSIFEGTIRNNLILGNHDISDNEIINACKKAEIWEHISSLPQGLDTVVGTDGAGLSGGQAQRIAIARIYLKNPQIIIYDEATSALDDETEDLILENWDSISNQTTSITIAHRLKSVMKCDRVALLNNGKISIVDTPDNLINNNKEFRELFNVK